MMISERGKKIRETNYKKYGRDFYRQIGKLGGAAKTDKPRGFATMDRENVAELGRRGGSISRRES